MAMPRRRRTKQNSSWENPIKLILENRQYKRHKKDKYQEEEPFLVTNIKVGCSLILLGFVSYLIYSVKVLLWDGGFGFKSTTSSSTSWRDGSYSDVLGADFDHDEKPSNTKFPDFELKEGSQYDAYGIAEELLDAASHTSGNLRKSTQFVSTTLELRKEFAELVGGENAAREILRTGLYTFSKSDSNLNASSYVNGVPEGIRHTANRIIKAIKTKSPFKLSFTGSSAVAGRGNYFDQTFPSVLAGILTEPMDLMGIELIVRNAAVADTSTFPNGLCLKNFLGSDADMVSWDAGMNNRQDKVSAFEGYLRNTLIMDHSPMLFVRESADTNLRKDLIQKYIDIDAIHDPVIIDISTAAKPFLGLAEEIIPEGFKDWMEFGGPPGAPGKNRINLSLKQHQMIGWLLSMHFLSALELAVASMIGSKPLFEDGLALDGERLKTENDPYFLPPPFSSKDINVDKSLGNLPSVLFGEPVGELGSNSSQWSMDPIHCRTSFDPTITGKLKDIIISGKDAEDIDLLLPRGPMHYNKNWVLDLGPESKQSMGALKQYDLGYQDSRKAYYGVGASGKMNLFLPFERDGYETKRYVRSLETANKSPLTQEHANDYFKSVIVCEVTDYRGEDQCNLERDVSFVLGGVNATATYISANGVTYRGKKSCVSMHVPNNSLLTTKQEMEQERDELKDLSNQRSLLSKTNNFGISLEIAVSGKEIFWKEGPCSVSHVIWVQTSAQT